MRKTTLILVISAVFLTSCGANKNKLIIFQAGSLASPMRDMAQAYKKMYPKVEILMESTGSRKAARKISELNRAADLLMVSDYKVIEDLAMPEHADWYICFARNKMVLAFTNASRNADRITATNWYRILTGKGVNYGHGDPNLDPCGYRALMVWQLAEKYYCNSNIYETLREHCPPHNVRPSEIELISPLESLQMDYAFIYLSLARQHNLRYIELPEEIDLSNPRLRTLYEQAKVDVSGKKRGEKTTITGGAIVYALTVPKVAFNKPEAIKFVKFILSKEGQEIMKRNGQPPISPPIVNDPEKLPQEFRGLDFATK